MGDPSNGTRKWSNRGSGKVFPSSRGRMTRRGRLLCRTSESATLPNQALLTPVRPWVVMMTILASICGWPAAPEPPSHILPGGWN